MRSWRSILDKSSDRRLHLSQQKLDVVMAARRCLLLLSCTFVSCSRTAQTDCWAMSFTTMTRRHSTVLVRFHPHPHSLKYHTYLNIAQKSFNMSEVFNTVANVGSDSDSRNRLGASSIKLAMSTTMSTLRGRGAFNGW